MKNIFKYFLVGGLGLFMFQTAATAGNPIKLNKTITKIDEGNYTIRLESYVTGESMTDITTTSKPVDLVLVLDVSGSMRDSAGQTSTTYTALPSQSYSYKGYGQSSYYFLYEGQYYRVYRGDTGNGRDRRYYMYFMVNAQTVYYLKANTITTDRQIAQVSSNEATIYTGVLYESKTLSKKIDFLKEACKAFVEEIYKNSLGPDGIAGTSDDIDNQISIVKFAKAAYYGSEDSLAEGNHYDGSINNYNMTEVVKMLKSVKDNKSDLIDGINSLTASGATAADYGMTKASYVLNAIPEDRESNKVVLLFTDGEPNHGSGFSTTVANACINEANTIKNTYGARVYTVGVFTGLTTSEQRNVNAYMSCVSSRYENVTSMPNDAQDAPTKYAAQNGTVGGGVAYYQTSNGSDLKSIFESIAHGSTSGGSTIKVDATSSTIIDVVSANFTIPKEAAAQGIKVWTETCTAYDEEKGIGTNWSYDNNLNNVEGLTPVIVGNELQLTGFNYTKDDVWDDAHTHITYPGNWVGIRTINSVKTTSGKRLVVEFNVELNPEYSGGQDMPSNDLNSGLYYKDKDGNDKYEPYPVPHVEFPSICIMKDGLKVGDSAIFEVKDGNSNLINTVVLTQKESGGVLEPCYVVIKKLSAGEYTVTETDWSWAYTPSTKSMTKKLDNLVIPETWAGTYSSAKEYLLSQGEDLNNNNNIVGVQIKDDKDDNQVYCVLKEKYNGSYTSEYSNSAISVLFHFTNTHDINGKPARGEAWVHNRFKGGTATSGGTEEGTEEEEEGIDD